MAADTGYSPIPSVQPTMDALPSQQVPADEETFGAGIGRSLRRTGAIMRQAADAEFDLTLQMERQSQETQALDASSEFSRQASAVQLEYNKLKGQQAVNGLPEYQKRLRDLRGEIGKSLKKPLAQRAYKFRTDSYETSALNAFGTHAANESDAAYLAALDGSIGAAKDRAVQKVLSGQNAAIDYSETLNETLAKAQFLGLDKKGADALVQQNTNAITAQVIQALVAAGRPEEANALLKGSQITNAPGTDVPLLSGEVIAPLTANVQGGLVKKGTDYVQSLDPLQRVDVLSKAIEGRTGTPADFLDQGDKVEGLRQAQDDLRILAERAQAARDKELAEINERKASDLKIRVNRGLATVPEIDRAFERNEISGAQRAEWIKQIEDNGGPNGDLAVFSALNGSAVLDPKNPDDVKAVNGFFNRNVAPQLAQLRVPFAGADRDKARAGVTEFVMRTGIMPDPVKRTIRGGLRSGSPQFRVTAADMIDRLSESAPYVLNDFSVEDIALGKSIAQSVRDGMPPEEAIKLADDMQRIPTEVKDLRRQRMRARVGNGQSMVEQASGRALGSMQRSTLGYILGYPSVTVGDAATAEFRRMFEEAYVLTGDEQQAYDSASAVFKRSWGVSNISGQPTLTKNAPEKLYGVLDHGADDGAWIRQQLVNDVNQALAPAPGDISAPPPGMIEPGVLAPAELGDNWATFEVAEDGIHKTIVLPTEPGDRPANDATGFLGDAVQRWRNNRERMVGVFVDEESAQAVMRAATSKPPTPAPVIHPDRIIAAPDMQTGGNGTYGVMIRNDSGALEPMLDKSGRPMRWRPDFATSGKAAEIRAKKALEVEQARRERRIIMEQPVFAPGL